VLPSINIFPSVGFSQYGNQATFHPLLHIQYRDQCFQITGDYFFFGKLILKQAFKYFPVNVQES
jgi:hypothetical protein